MATARRIAAHSLTAPSCQFSGLVRFPYDNLVCGIEIGGWSWSGGYQGISLRGGTGYSFRSQPHVCFCGADPCQHREFTGSPTDRHVCACTQERADRAQVPFPTPYFLLPCY